MTTMRQCLGVARWQLSTCVAIALWATGSLGPASAASQTGSSNATPAMVITTVEPFAKYLRADPLLLQCGGTRLIVLPDSNEVMIVSVASTAVKDNSGADRVRMQKVCHQKALAGLLTAEKGLKVKYALETKDATTAAFADGQEQAASLESMLETTSAQAEGFVRDLPVVGIWYSADGQMFFLAIGGVRPRTGKAEAKEK